MSLKPEYEVRLDLSGRTIYCRMTGLFQLEDISAWAHTYREATDRFRGRKHVVIADMRGMRSMLPEVAKVLGEAIGHARRHGAALCAHLSDDTIQRLQARRVARENSPADDITVDVVSLEEAERVAHECAQHLEDTASPSIRGRLREHF